MNTLNRELVRWMLFSGIGYPLLCCLSVIMAISGGIITEPWDPPVPWYTAVVSKTGQTLGLILMWPLMLMGKHRFGHSIPGFDYVWMMLFGLLGGVIGFFIKQRLRRRHKS